ncbi:bifunctional folylpolyglutamate synthase/dihydrofolate synthase [Candidatus Acetothermia bacterium]|jgi:dihydrofolate synthase/folylpolyglutamate synthase|nr:bifunctional folylpolyglutamate synthase/dihydrofolate synthase [Candidatus Acetothermia bacterium]MCI2426883.1 bifunctional folylpolyglutamate synthase/dihydrofolate synthase [Candidatus Acetothermia bacterium]MCI2428627.1 bifunctional folylpolyglutamate synthase/dihydrofolate synthase [Candidatus Acetothermia bacterium]
MEYSEACAILKRLPFREVKPGIERISYLLSGIGDPQQSIPVIHIAGTNGKGSVAAMLATILQSAGYRVGFYISPELIDIRERIQVNSEWISKEDFARCVAELAPLLAAAEDKPTIFEALTAMAFLHFFRRGVEIIVLEAGLGGRFDATNVATPLLTIITNTDRDHLEILGGSVETVAWEHAGIAAYGVPLLIGDHSAPLEEIISQECDRIGALLTLTTGVIVEQAEFDWHRAVYNLEWKDFCHRVDIPLLGGYQQNNLRIVGKSIEILRRQGLSLPDSAVLRGLSCVRWPGRFEVVHHRPYIVIDGAHNVAGVQALASDVIRYSKEFLPSKPRYLIFGVLDDKEVEEMCRILFPLFSKVILTMSQSERAVRLDRLITAATSLAVPYTATESVTAAVHLGSKLLTAEDLLVVGGSLTVAGEARKLYVK